MAYLNVGGECRIYFERYPAGRVATVRAHGWGMGCRVSDNTVARIQGYEPVSIHR